MKKFFVGLFVGAALSFTVSAHAEVVNMIGKVVDGVFPVFLDGKELSNQAIVIEGTSYLPVRSAAESLGLDVEFKDNQVLLNEPTGGKNMVTTTQESNVLDFDQSQPEAELKRYQGAAQVVEKQIETNKSKGMDTTDLENTLQKMQNTINQIEGIIQQKMSSPEYKQEQLKAIEDKIESTKLDIVLAENAIKLNVQNGIDYQQQINDLQKQLEDLEQQKAELENQAP